MPIGTSDGDHFESDMHQQLDLPSVFDDAENKKKHLSSEGRGPLKITITPHMNEGEDQQDTQQLPGEMYSYPPSKYKGNINTPIREPEDFDYIQKDNESDKDFRDRMGPENYRDLLDNGYDEGPVKGGGYGFKTKRPQSSLTEPKEVHIVRHGETTANDDNTVRGTKMPKAADKLKEAGVDTLVASPLERSKETAEIIGKKLGVTPQYDPRLATWDVGEHEGKPCETSNPVLEDYAKNKQDEPVPGGESFNDFTNRSFAGIRDAVLNNKDKNLAIITHNRVEATLRGWEKTGQDNSNIDYKEAVKEETEPGVVRKTTFQPDSTILQPGPAVKNKQINPTMKSMRDALVSHIMEMSERTKQSLQDILLHPENLPTTGNLGIFGGQNALTAELGKLFQAKHLKYNTTTPANEIFRKTGWYQDIDRHWKHFIPNEDTSLKEGQFLQPQPLSKFAKAFNEKAATDWKIEANPNLLRLPKDYAKEGRLKLSDIYQNKNLFEAYPHVKDIPIKIDERSLGAGGYARIDKKTGQVIEIGLPAVATRENYLTALQHELQHFVQGEEGFSSGATSANMSYKDYWNTSGEVEARNASLWLQLEQEAKEQNLPANEQVTKVLMPPDTYKDVLDLEGSTPADIVVRNNRAGVSDAPKVGRPIGGGGKSTDNAKELFEAAQEHLKNFKGNPPGTNKAKREAQTARREEFKKQVPKTLEEQMLDWYANK